MLACFLSLLTSACASRGFSVQSQDAKNGFANATTASAGDSQAIGAYSAGCLQGASSLAIEGNGYEVMHPSRHRYFGHPQLVHILERAGHELGQKRLLLYGDLSMPRGGPMPTGHASHQVGLDVDIWFLGWPTGTFKEEQRESLDVGTVLSADYKSVDPKKWRPEFAEQILWFAAQPEVERIFVNVAIKKQFCLQNSGDPRLQKLRPWFGHDDHFHVRLRCPVDSPACVNQEESTGDECDEAHLSFWYSDAVVAETRSPKETSGRAVRLPEMCLKQRAQ